MEQIENSVDGRNSVVGNEVRLIEGPRNVIQGDPVVFVREWGTVLRAEFKLLGPASDVLKLGL